MGLMKSGTRGEIVQVQGGHIVRSTGRKDRHSKVYTAKGPRDRRVRLSAHTAIEFYDVQDRLGYDRPSKAVDWLIKKAKSAIDKLAELPPWNPTDNNTSAEADRNVQGSNEIANTTGQSESSLYNFQLHENPDKNSSFIPQYSDTIADPMKPFFPTSSATTSINFQNYAPDLFPRTSNSAQDLGLSLHSFQDHGLIHTQSQSDRNHIQPNDHNTLFASSGPVGYETGSYQRMVEWNNEASVENRGEGGNVNGGGFLFNSLPLTQEVLLGQGSGFAQRGTLQSSFSPLVRAWDDLPMPMPSPERTQILHQPSIFGTRFAFNGLPTLCFPTSIQCEEDKGEHSVVSKRLSSSSSPNSTQH